MGLSHGGNVFAVAREQGWNWRDVLDFSASINPLGPAPGVRDALLEAAERIVHYPERESPELCAALASAWSVEADQLLVGNGATELIFFLGRVLAPERVSLATPVFSEFHRAFPDADLVKLGDPGTWPDRELLVLTRPANPTGWTLPLEEIENWLTSRHTLVVDESFLDFSRQPSAASLLNRYDNVIVLRSLTKFYALPGVRIGALIASSKNIRMWRQQREPWQVNVFAERTALAALADADHAAASRAFVETEREWLMGEVAAIIGAEPLPSDANFIHVRLQYPASQLCEKPSPSEDPDSELRELARPHR